jgi:tungstate transport system ATP-binding protein
MDAVYRLKSVKKAYGGRTVVDIDGLEIRRGEFLAIVGPSGAGKSTLLRMLNFLEYPDEGQIEYAGQAASASIPMELRRQVTTVFQHPALLHDSVENNVAYGLRLRGQRDCRSEVRAILARMGLEKLRRSQARTLSGGEAQRVALARAVIVRPEVLLLDEPSANLDPYNIGLIEEVMKEVNQTRATTMVMVTHNVFQAKRMAQRVALILDGRIIEIASTNDFFESPRDDRTRAFVNGEMIY